MPQASTTARQPTTRWPMAGLSLTMLMPSLATSTANVAIPSLARTFAASFQAVQWIVLAYLLTVTALVAVAGRLGDIVGRRRLPASFAMSIILSIAQLQPALPDYRSVEGFFKVTGVSLLRLWAQVGFWLGYIYSAKISSSVCETKASTPSL